MNNPVVITNGVILPPVTCGPHPKSNYRFMNHETQSNLTVASLLGGLCWVIYFSFNTFLTDSKTADPKNILEKINVTVLY